MDFEKFIGDKKEINMGFIGGSITEGAGASAQDKCFVSRACEELGKKYDGVQFNKINAGVGGTTSNLGLFRMERDLLSKKPDIVFIEFAVNDIELEYTGVYVENIIRQTYQYNKEIPVVILLTAKVENIEKYGAVRNTPSAKQHIEIGKYYNIPVINMGDEMYEYANENGIDFNDLFCDGVHPKDSGYEIYTNIILKHLKRIELNIIDDTLPLLYKRRISNPRLLMGSTLANDTWKLSCYDMYGRLPNYIYSYTPGDELTFEFDGTFLGIYYTVEKDSGTLEYKVDNREWQKEALWDKYALGGNRAHYLTLCEELNDGTHTVTIRNSYEKEEKSEGHYVRIGAFTVG